MAANNKFAFFLDVNRFAEKKLVLFGAGNCGQDYYEQFSQKSVPVLAWVANRPKEGLPVKPVEVLKDLEYDVILIAVESESTAAEIRKQLQSLGVPEEKMLWSKPVKMEPMVINMLNDTIPVIIDADEESEEIENPEDDEAFERMLASANPSGALAHTFRRFEEIVKRDRLAREMVEEISEFDAYVFRITNDPGGELTPEQKKRVDEFWKPYEFAYHNNPELQRLFSVGSGKFSPCYFPWGLFLRYGVRTCWNAPGIVFARNKNYTELVFPGVKQAKRYVRRINGVFYDGERRKITLDEACEICWQNLQELESGKMLVKPWEGGGARGIQILRKSFSREDICEAFRRVPEDFCCEEFLVQHESWAAAHPESVNTVRVITLMHKGEVHLVGIMYHFGVSEELANIETDGLMACVSEDGTIDDVAFDEFCKRFYVHPSGYQFAGKKLYNTEGMVEKAKALHTTIPQQRIMTWEFSADKEGEPVLIEVNAAGEYRMLEMRGVLPLVSEEITKEMLDEILIKKFYYSRASWRWNYREYSDHIVIEKYCGTESRVTVPWKIRGKPVTALLNFAFSDKMVDEIIIPECIKSIGRKAFYKIGNPNCRVVRKVK